MEPNSVVSRILLSSKRALHCIKVDSLSLQRSSLRLTLAHSTTLVDGTTLARLSVVVAVVVITKTFSSPLVDGTRSRCAHNDRTLQVASHSLNAKRYTMPGTSLAMRARRAHNDHARHAV